MNVHTETVKVAWIRNRDIPPGQPAPGHINCPCGDPPETVYKAGPDITCNCGVVYTWNGWIVSKLNPLRSKFYYQEYE